MTNSINSVIPPFKFFLVAPSENDVAPMEVEVPSSTAERFYVFFQEPCPNEEAKQERELFKSQINLIEKILPFPRTAEEHSFRACLRTRINALLLSEASFIEKMAELGALYFYLEQGVVLEEGDYYPFLLQRLEKEVEECDTEALCNKYIQIRCVQLLVTPKDEINLGAAFTILQLLESQFALFFDENKTQVKNFLIYFIKNPALMQLLDSDDKVTLHPDVMEYIRRDLCFPEDRELTPADMKKAFLLIFFNDLRQFSEGNCFAVGAIIAGLQHSPYKLFVVLLHLMHIGGIKFEDDLFFPIARLLGKRKLEGNNNLQQILVSFVQFMNLNFADSPDEEDLSLKTCFFSHLKNRLIEEVKKAGADSLTPLCQSFCLKLEAFFKCFWFEDCFDTLQIEGDNIILEDRRIDLSQFQGNREKLIQILSARSELVYGDQNGSLRVHTFQEFRNLLFGFTTSTLNELMQNSQFSEKDKIFMNCVYAFWHSELLTEALAQFLMVQNEFEDSITVQNYKELGELFFAQKGGCPERAFKYFDLNFKMQPFKGDKGDFKHILALFQWLHALPSDSPFKNGRSLFLCNCKTHTFLLTPYRFGLLWSEDPQKVLQEVSLKPAQRILNRPISENKLRRILLNTSCGIAEINSLVGSYKEKTALVFKDALLKKLHPSFHEKFKRGFDSVLHEISYIDIVSSDKLKQILNKVLNNGPSELIDSIVSSVCEYLKEREVYDILPITLANYLRSCLIQHEIYGIETYDLEPYICHFFEIPCEFEIADLNYLENEANTYQYLMFGYKLSEGDFALTSRAKGANIPLEKELAEGLYKLEIFYPALT